MKEGSFKELQTTEFQSQDMLVTGNNIQVRPHLRSLYTYLKENYFIEVIKDYNSDYLNIFSREILTQIEAGTGEWKEAVPETVVQMIKKQKLFNYQSDKKSPQGNGKGKGRGKVSA